jgi:putative peptidoglycan lipid II flippase
LGDSTENEGQALLAIDGNIATAWTTDTYKDAEMSGKAGVGLLLDLGVTREVFGLDLDFIAGHTAEIYVVNSAMPDLATETKFADIAPTEISTSFGTSDSASGRYVLIWITPDLPANDSGEFQGGISEVKVRL